MQEPVSESLDGTLDARAFDYINSDTNHAHLVNLAERTGCLGEALRRPHRAMATVAVALQCWCSIPHSFRIICHSGEHFLDCIFQTDPHRTRYDCVTDVEFGQIRNLVNERDVLVIDAVTGVDLHMGF
jgi:hypothetical protein